MKLIDRVRTALEESLKPTEIEILDESQYHSGGNSETRAIFNLKIISPQFANKSLVQQHRMIYDCLGEELNSGIHALAIKSSAPNS